MAVSLIQALSSANNSLNKLRYTANQSATDLGKIRTSASGSAESLSQIKTRATQADSSVAKLKSSGTQAQTGLNQIRTSATQGSTALNRIKGSTDNVNSSLGRLRTAASQSRTQLNNIRTSANQSTTAFGKAKTGTDHLRTALDKLKGAAEKSRNALRDVKRQADAVETSVGKAGKGADSTGKSMGALGKGLKGASAAQKGLNLAMASNPMGLLMVVLSPLIAKFVDMDKIVSTLQKGLVTAWKVIREKTSEAADKMRPVIDGIGTAMKGPVNGIVSAVNFLIDQLNKIHVSIPGWVPGVGGKSFGISLGKLAYLAEGGIVMPRYGGTPAVIGEAGEPEAVIPLSRLRAMVGTGAPPANTAALTRLAAAMERMAERPVLVQVDSQTIARAVQNGERQLARR